MREDGPQSDRTANPCAAAQLVRPIERNDPAGLPSGPEPPRPAAPTDFSRLAKRVVSRTTDLIVVGVVAVAALAAGRQVVEWWHSDPPAIANRPETPAGWEHEDAPVLLEFGDYPVALTRRPFRGSFAEAQSALEQQCRQRTESAGETVREQDAAEARLLAQTTDLQPIDERAGAWQLYSITEPLPLVIGVRLRSSQAQETAGAERRLVCWGMTVPMGENSWLLYTFQTANSHIRTGELPAVSAPPGGRRILSLRDERGGGLVGVSGAGPAEDWMSFYDDWFSERGWTSPEGWAISPTSWSAVFFQRENESGNISVQISRDADGRLVGMVSLTAGS